MATATGVLKRVHENNKGRNTFYSICVDVNGEDTWYGTGRNKVTATEGSTIEFGFSQNGRYSNVEGDVKVVDAAPPQAAGGGTRGYVDHKEQYWQDKAVKDEKKDLQYNYRAAHMFAKDVVMGLVSGEHIALPADKKKTVEAVLGYIDTVAEEYYEKFLMEDPAPGEGADDVVMD